MSTLTESQRGEIVGLYKNNVPNYKITRIIGVHRTTVAHTIKNYLDEKDLVIKNRCFFLSDKEILVKVLFFFLLLVQ